MTTHLFQHLAMIAQEAGADPGTGLKAWQTFTIFIVTPVALFTLITATVLFFTRKKKSN
jgi:hypothetical protein